MSGFWLRCRYWFDSALARGAWANILLLIVIALLVAILLTPLILWLTPLDDHGSRRGALATFWETFGREFRLALPHPSRTSQLVLQLLIGATAVFFGAAVTSVLVSGLIGKLIALRGTGSRVMESGHVVVLGWSEQIFTVIDELATAAAGRRRLVVAVLADVDTAVMNAAIVQRVRQRRRVRVVCRRGVPLDEDDLLLMNLTRARSVILLHPPRPGDIDPDTNTIKTLLALSTQPDLAAPVVAAMSSTGNMEVARLAGGRQATVLDADDLIARLITHAARQPGVSAILTDLFNFAGAEVRLTRQPTLAGTAFGATLTAFAQAVPIGLVRAEGGTVLNPPHGTILAEGDQLVVLTEDYGALKPAPPGGVPVVSRAIVTAEAAPAQPVRHLVLGWNRRGPRILADLTEHAAPGSIITVVGGEPGEYTMGNANVTVHSGRTCDRSTLTQLHADTYHQVIVLAADGPALAADAAVISTLLHLRAVLGDRRHGCTVVSEVRDDRDRKLIQATRVDDFIVSDHLISLLMAQLSEQSAVGEVFAQLLGGAARVCLRPAADLIRPGVSVTFATIVESARRQGRIAIGYRHARGTAEAPGFGVVLNPPQAAEVELNDGDQIALLAAQAPAVSQAV